MVAKFVCDRGVETYGAYRDELEKLISDRFPVPDHGFESRGFVLLDSAGYLGAIHLPGAISERVSRYSASAFGDLQSVGMLERGTDKHPFGFGHACFGFDESQPFVSQVSSASSPHDVVSLPRAESTRSP